MADRTHPAQPDEALRRAQTVPLSTRELRTRAGLTWIADRLTGFRSSEDMTSNARTAAALRYSTDLLGDTRDANGLYYDLLQALPTIDREMTRGEYALILRRQIGGEA
ncbi:hypothetical protein [Streptomyces sp. NPDC056056]|uniref:hypothetical protein n=1 Tax=Streptomyces sp. NPDC056056 TaxID=3345698 RepID=UPI0035E18C89